MGGRKIERVGGFLRARGSRSQGSVGVADLDKEDRNEQPPPYAAWMVSSRIDVREDSVSFCRNCFSIFSLSHQ